MGRRRKVLEMVPKGGLSLEDVCIGACIGITVAVEADRLGWLCLRRCKLVNLACMCAATWLLRLE